MNSERKLPSDRKFDEMAITRDRAMVEAVYKFRFFFVGLVFAVLSFAMQFPVTTDNTVINYIEASSWLILLLTGFLAIRDCGGFCKLANEEAINGLTEKWRQLMWLTFFASIGLLFIAKATVIFYTSDLESINNIAVANCVAIAETLHGKNQYDSLSKHEKHIVDYMHSNQLSEDYTTAFVACRKINAL